MSRVPGVAFLAWKVFPHVLAKSTQMQQNTAVVSAVGQTETKPLAFSFAFSARPQRAQYRIHYWLGIYLQLHVPSLGHVGLSELDLTQ